MAWQYQHARIVHNRAVMYFASSTISGSVRFRYRASQTFTKTELELDKDVSRLNPLTFRKARAVHV
jgi:hypothetical protein